MCSRVLCWPDSAARMLVLVCLLCCLLVAMPCEGTEVPFAPRGTVGSLIPDAIYTWAGDVDGDGDLDVVGTAMSSDGEDSNSISWWENTNGDGSAWAEHQVEDFFDGAYGIHANDVDGDGDLDVIATAYFAGDIAWWENTSGDGTTWSKHTIDASLTYPRGVFSADMDGDGDVDALGALVGDDDITWWENTAGDGSAWTGHTVNVVAFNGAYSVVADDVDGDGDMDVLGAAMSDSDIAWWENTNGAGTSWTKHTVDPSYGGARGVFAADVDGDGDVDVLGAALSDDDITWWENTAGDGSSWTERTIDGSLDGAHAVFAADVDGDGDMDAIGAGNAAADVAWYENADGTGTSWNKYIVDASLYSVLGVHAADLNGDGKMDLMAAAAGAADMVAWYENETIQGIAEFPLKRNLTTTANAPYGLDAADMDGDGNMDLVCAVYSDSHFVWWENLNGDGNTWTQRSVSDATFTGAYGVDAADMDGDGDMDVLGAAYNVGDIAWWENTNGAGTAWSEHAVDSGFGGAIDAVAVDIDRDGDLDVVGAAYATPGDSLSWWENTNGVGTSWSKQVIDSAVSRMFNVAVGDIDGDGTMDIAAAGYTDGEVYAWLNTKGDGGLWSKVTVGSSQTNAYGIHLGDIDRDGKLDILSTAQSTDEVIWWRNIKGNASLWQEYVIDSGFDGARGVYSADADNDGDLDVFATAVNADDVIWYENTAGDGSSWTKHLVEDFHDGASFVHAADVNGDGLPDLIASAYVGDTVSWWENWHSQFSVAAADIAPSVGLEGTLVPFLRMEVTHNGNAEDSDMELVEFTVKFEEKDDDALTNEEFFDIFDSFWFYLDDGTGHFESDQDTAVTVSMTKPVNGLSVFTLGDGDANVQIAPGDTARFFIVGELLNRATPPVPNQCQVTLMWNPGIVAEDRTGDIPLAIGPFDNVTSGVVHISEDTDSDGISDYDEVNGTLGYVTDPTRSDTDGDGVDDLMEIDLGYDPTDDTDTPPDLFHRVERMWPRLPQPWYFSGPIDVAVHRDGMVYVANNNTGVITKITSDGHYVKEWAGDFNYLHSIAVSPSGRVVALDSSSIQVFNSEGEFLLEWPVPVDTFNSHVEVDGFENIHLVTGSGTELRLVRFRYNTTLGTYMMDDVLIDTLSGTGSFIGPGALWVSEDGATLHVGMRWSDLNTHYSGRVDTYSWDATNGYMHQNDFVCSTSPSLWFYPHGIAATREGLIAVGSDWGDSSVRVFDSVGTPVTAWNVTAPDWPSMYGLAYDEAAGNLLAAFRNGERVERLNLNDGTTLASWGSGGGDPGRFAEPRDTAIHGTTLFVADYYNQRVQKFDFDGQYLGEFATTSDPTYAVRWPSDIAIDAAGNIFVGSVHDPYGDAGSWDYYLQEFSASGTLVRETEVADDIQGIAIHQATNRLYYCVRDAIHACNITGGGLVEFALWNDGYPTLISLVRDVAVDSDGNVYVAWYEHPNSHVTKYTYDGVPLFTWDVTSNISRLGMSAQDVLHVTMSYTGEVLRYTRSGEFIDSWGGKGSLLGLHSFPRGVSVNSVGEVFVADSQNHRMQKYQPLESLPNSKAIVVAGRAPNDANWEAAQASASHATWVLSNAGYTKDSIYFLSPDYGVDVDGNGLADDVDALATAANLQSAITSWASGADDLVLYMVGHGHNGIYRINESEVVEASALGSWLGSTTVYGQTVCAYDACESGSFHGALSAPIGSSLAVVTSTAPGQTAKFIGKGTISFSNFFWSQIFDGASVGEAVQAAVDLLDDNMDLQEPQADSNGDGSLDPPSALNGIYIGTSLPYSASRPLAHSLVCGAGGTANAVSIQVDVDSGPDGDAISRVWAVVRPDAALQSDPGSPLRNLPTVDLLETATPGRYTAEYDGITGDGSHLIAVYAMDEGQSLSLPVATNYTPAGALATRGIIVAGGSANDTSWHAYERAYERAYEAMRTQLIPPEDIYILAPAPIADALADGVTIHEPTLENLDFALSDWLGTGTTGDLNICMVGPGGNDIFELNPTETMTAPWLAIRLEAAQIDNGGGAPAGGMVTLAYDACDSGSFLDNLAAADRIVVTSAAAGEPARFPENGEQSFSRFFWGHVLSGATVEDAFQLAQQSMDFAGSGQVAQLDDNGDGLANTNDGLVARYHHIGAGIGIGEDDPSIDTAGFASGSNLLWADGVGPAADERIARVWAAITPPNYQGGSCAPILPAVPLSRVAEGSYEATYAGFTQADDYGVTFYAMDIDGNISAGVEMTVAGSGVAESTPPSLAAFSPTHGATGVARKTAIVADVQDLGTGVDPYGVSMAVMGLDVTSDLALSYEPGGILRLTYARVEPFALGETVVVAIDAADLGGNHMTTQVRYFTITDGVDSGDADHLPDDWVDYYDSLDPASEDWSDSGDPDGDGYTNDQEAEGGTDPLMGDTAGVPPDDFEDDDRLETATWIDFLGGIQDHTFHDLGDQDWFAFHGFAGKLYTFEFSGMGASAGPKAVVYASDGVTEEHTGTPGLTFTWTPPSSGIYYARLTNHPLTTFGNACDYRFRIFREEAGFDVTAAISPYSQRQNVGNPVTLDGSDSYDPDYHPAEVPPGEWYTVGEYAWSFVSKPAGSGVSLGTPTSAVAGFTPDAPGEYVIDLEVTDHSGIASSQARASVVVDDSATGNTRWVDFSNAQAGTGSESNPFNAVWRAAGSVPAGGTIRVLPGEQTESIRLGAGAYPKAMLLEVEHGGGGSDPAVIGRGGVPAPPAPPATATQEGANSEMVAAILGLLRAHAAADADDQDESAGLAPIYESVMPNTVGPDGNYQAAPGAPLAIRIRSQAGVEPSSVWADLQPLAQESALSWMPVTEGDLRDIWVIAKPGETDVLDTAIALSGGARDTNGEEIAPARADFTVAEEAGGAPELWQPVPGADYVSEEAASAATLAPAPDGSGALAEGLGDPLVIGPNQVYETPQRVWLPLPQGVPADSVTLFYYHPNGANAGWYPADQVEGWVVPGSYLEVEVEGTRYLGFLVRHAGLVQLAASAE